MERKSLPKLVLDAWAMIAFVQGEEPAASRIMQVIGDAEQNRVLLYMSWINLGEVYYTVGRQKGEEEARQTLEDISLLPIRLTEVSKQAVLDAATYKMRFPISYADAFALALTNSVEGKLLTGDPELIKLDQFVAMEQLDRLNP